MLDIAIIGAGPGGLAVANTLQRAGFSVRVFERGCIAQSISEYPTFMRFFSTRELLEIDGYPLTIVDEKPSRAEYLRYLARFAEDRRIPVRTYTEVLGVRRLADGTFETTIKPMGGHEEAVASRFVVVACGGWENPVPLGVPGEELPKTTHRFTETHPYYGKRVLVVGGRNSAVETALILHRAGARVAISYRRGSFDGAGLKYWLRPDIENRIQSGEIEGHLETDVVRIEWDHVVLRRKDGGEYPVANDFVIACTGYAPPAGFLRSLGIEVDPDTNIPAHNAETLETNVPGLFVAGVIIAGNVSGRIFIENMRTHGENILRRIAPDAAKGDAPRLQHAAVRDW